MKTITVIKNDEFKSIINKNIMGIIYLDDTTIKIDGNYQTQNAIIDTVRSLENIFIKSKKYDAIETFTTSIIGKNKDDEELQYNDINDIADYTVDVVND